MAAALMLALLLVTTSSAFAGGTVIVSSCGVLVPHGVTGVLTQDLTCDGSTRRCRDYPETTCTTSDDCPNKLGCNAVAIYLDRGAKLEMGGRNITMTSGTGTSTAVGCRDRSWCTVRNGSITGVTNMLSNLGVWSLGRVRLLNMTITNCGVAVESERLVVRDVTVTGNGNGLETQRLRARNAVASDNVQTGIFAGYTMTGRGITTERNGIAGIFLAGRYVLTDVQAHQNGNAGIYVPQAGQGWIRSSNITQNTYLGSPMDILVASKPVISGVTCDVSGQFVDFNQPAGGGLGLCAVQ